MSKYVIIREELDSNVPLYGSMTDQEAADEFNVFDKSARGGIDGMFEYLLNNKYRTNQNFDTQNTALLGRLRHVANSNVGDDPFNAMPGATDYTVDLRGKHAAEAFLSLTLSVQLSNIDFENLNLPYAACTQVGVWDAADVDALKALSQNLTSRGQQLGLPRLNENDITIARAQ